MTVNTEKSYQKYVGNGETTLFSVPFEFLDEEIIVFKGNSLEAYKKGVDYFISDRDVVFNTAPAEGEILYITRKVVLKQLVDFINGDSFPAENYEYSLDHITHALQELSLWIEQSWKSPLGTSPQEEMDKLIRSYVGENFSEKFESIDNQIDRLFTLFNQASNKFQDYYTKIETDNKLDLKANKKDFYTKTEVDNKIATFYTKEEVDSKIGDIDSVLDLINGEVI
jgi:TolB-like protein